MKKIKLGICTVICALCALTSCTDEVSESHTVNSNTITCTRTYSNNLSCSSSFEIHKMVFEGHECLYVIESAGHRGYFGLTHSGNCPCHKNK